MPTGDPSDACRPPPPCPTPPDVPLNTQGFYLYSNHIRSTHTSRFYARSVFASPISPATTGLHDAVTVNDHQSYPQIRKLSTVRGRWFAISDSVRDTVPVYWRDRSLFIDTLRPRDARRSVLSPGGLDG